MVFLPPDPSATAHPQNPYSQANGSVPSYQTEAKQQSVTTSQEPAHYPTHTVDNGACDGGAGGPYPGQEYSYHYTPQSMILVQVNPGETFTIQAEDGTQCIQGPAQVPMVSPNGAIPPIHVPHGYISQVIEENGLRRVVVIPEMPQAHFAGTTGGQPMGSSPQPHGRPHITMQPGPHHINYMQQMNMMPLNQQTTMYPAAEHHLPMFHQPPITYVQTEGSLVTDPTSRLPQHQHQFHIHSANMDPASSGARAAKAKERLQKKLMERHQQPGDSNKNPSPTSTSSISPSSSSSYAATPSPNSSPDSSPRIIGGSVHLSTYSNGFNNRKPMHQYPVQQPQQLLSSPQSYQYPSPAHSPNFHPGGNVYRNSKNPQMQPPRVSATDDMSSGSSSGGSPRRAPNANHHVQGLPQDIGHFQANMHQRDIVLQSMGHLEPFPKFDGKNSLREFLSAITKPEVYDIAPRSANIKWSMRFSFPKEPEWHMQEQKISYEVYLSDKGGDPSKFQRIHRDCGTYFLIKDLKPGFEYHAVVLAELDSVKGTFSEAAHFRTLSCPPDTPGAPKCSHRTKNSLTLKWAAPHDNGEKIIKYHIEWDEGKKGSGFRSLYSDSQKQYKVTKLLPAHNYTFRLNSVNKVGISPWSPEVTYTTTGTAPNTPDPPRLAKASVRTLLLVWNRTNSMAGDAPFARFTLEMDDVSQGYGFRAVYDGNDLRTLVKNLSRSSSYRFRLCSYNSEGKSNYSEVVTYPTLPDKPGPPGKVNLRGKAHPTWFKVAWDPPKDSGGAEITKYVLECSHDRGQPMVSVYSGPDREFTFANTQPGVSCRLRVFCVSDGGNSLPSDMTVIVPPPVVPGQCAPPRVASKAKPSVIPLRWDPPNYNGGSAVTSYEVAMESHEEEAAEPAVKYVYSGLNTEHSVIGLKPGTAYKFVVRAANKVGNGPWSDRVELETSPGCPEKPDAPEPDTVAASSILLTWKEPHDNGSAIIGYLIEWGHAESSMNVHHITTSLSHIFQQLSPDTVYFFRVLAQNEVGKGTYSDVVSVKTLPSFPDRVVKVWQSDNVVSETVVHEDEYVEEEDPEEEEDSVPSSATCAMIQWETPANNGAEITSYIIEITPVVSTQNKKKTHDEAPALIETEDVAICHLLTDLQPDSEYRIRVKAVNSVGSSAFSSPVVVETQPLPPEPPMVECTCSYNCLKLKWGEGDAFNNIYLLQMRDKHGRFVTIHNGSGRSFRVNRLSERTPYHFRINARNHAGEGPFSVTYTFTTTTAPPPHLKHPPSVNVRNDRAQITWDEIEPMKGDPVSYIVNLETVDGSGKQTCIVDEPWYRVDRLTPGNKYKVQVAAVRHVCTTRSGTLQQKSVEPQTNDVPPNEDVDATVDQASQASDDVPETEEIVGNFSNWVVFEASSTESLEEDEDMKAVSKSESLSSSSLLKATPVVLSDEHKAALLLATFFVSAVFLAFLVQFLFN